MNVILGYARENPAAAGAWFVLLFLMACIVGKLVKWEPMISGSGIPQVEGEMTGKLEQIWWRVLPRNSWEDSFPSGRAVSWKRRSIYTDRSHDGEGVVKNPGQGKDRGKISPYLRGQRRSGGSLSCAAGGGDVFPGRDT